MWVQVNGEWHEVEEPTTVADLVATVTASGTGVAVALDGVVVRRARWEETEVSDGARLDVMSAVPGG